VCWLPCPCLTAGEYGLQAKLTYDSAFVFAEIKAAVAVTAGGACDATPQLVTGKFVWTTPGSSEAVALLKGSQRCAVADEEADPVMTISGSMREVGPDYPKL
jgi:hypothetical protein